MNIKNILGSTEHRPWLIPQENWKYYQEWNKAIFLHWEVELSELKKYVPKELEIDTINGKPWVSLVAFSMEKIRPRNLPYFSPISNFHEINIRTYVKANNKTGVYFLSIEGGKKLSCKIAKLISKLPYRFSKIKKNKSTFKSFNKQYNDSLNISFSVGNTQKEKTPLDSWLTERYALFQDNKNSINEFEIHHLEWPISQLKIDKIEMNYERFKNLIKGTPNKISYSKGVQVVAWGSNQFN